MNPGTDTPIFVRLTGSLFDYMHIEFQVHSLIEGEVGERLRTGEVENEYWMAATQP